MAIILGLPSISILTPSLNQARFLEKTIRSVLDQNCPKLEYRILDGGSTDDSVEIIRKYESRLAGWISGPDGGQAAALARGFQRCNGEILAWLNSDDCYLPGALCTVGQAFENHPEIDLIYGDVVMVDPADHPLTIDLLPAYDVEDLKRLCMIQQPAAFWRAEAYRAVGGIDSSFQFCMDYDLFLRMAERGRFLHIPRLLAAFRRHPSSKTATLTDVWDREEETLRERSLGRKALNAADRRRLKRLKVRQIGEILRRRLGGEPLPCLTPARWERLARRKYAAAETSKP